MELGTNSKIKKNKFKIFNQTTATNLVIVAVLFVIGMLTFNFGSQYVFGEVENQAIYFGNRESNKVSLMVNVYWGTEFVQSMLDVFEEYGVKTTFFIGGTWAEKEQELLKKMYESGHEIGNHGYFHKDHKHLNYDQNYSEINVTHKLVYEILGIEMNLFAPPSGSFSKTTLNVAQKLGYKTIMWSKDTIDWRDKDAGIALTRSTKNVVGGDLILMHPTAHTLQALPQILEFYKNNNLVATTVSDVLSLN